MEQSATKSADEITASISELAASVFLRPSMHVGGQDSPSTAESLDCLLWNLLYLWCNAHNRCAEFSRIVDAVRKDADCDCLGFAGAFRFLHAGESDQTCTQFVLRQWQIVAERLALPLVDSNGNRVVRLA